MQYRPLPGEQPYTVESAARLARERAENAANCLCSAIDDALRARGLERRQEARTEAYRAARSAHRLALRAYPLLRD